MYGFQLISISIAKFRDEKNSICILYCAADYKLQ